MSKIIGFSSLDLFEINSQSDFLYLLLQRYWYNNRWNLIKMNETISVHPLDGEIYAQIINLSCAYDVYFHGGSEIMDIARKKITFSATDYTTVELIALEILTTNNAKG